MFGAVTGRPFMLVPGARNYFGQGDPLAPPNVAPEREARTAHSLIQGHSNPDVQKKGGRDGCRLRPLLWFGRAQADRGGVSGGAWIWQTATQRGAHVRHDDRRSPGAG